MKKGNHAESACGVARNRRQVSRGDGSKLLNGCPSVTDGCWWVVRVTLKVFDELLSVLAWSARGLEDKGDQVDAMVPVELFLLFPFAIQPGWAPDIETERQRDRETERQRDRETERQRDRETERQRDRETERQRDRETERQRDRETERQRDRGPNRP